MIQQFTQNSTNLPIFLKMKMCLLCQIVNNDSIKPQAKKIFHKLIRRNDSIIQEAISTIPKTTFCTLVHMVLRPHNANAQVDLQMT